MTIDPSPIAVASIEHHDDFTSEGGEFGADLG